MSDQPKTHDPSGTEASPTPTGAWSPRFPHAEIDALIQRLSDTSAHATVEETERLLQLIIREAERLRRSVVRLSVARLSAAEQEASDILTNAQAWADEVRARAHKVLGDRLDEADQVAYATRQTFLIEKRLRDNRTDASEEPNEEVQ